MKGKAVSVLHLYKDKLWEMGGKADPPEPELRVVQKDDESEKPGREKEKNEVQGSADETVAHSEAATPPPTSETEEPEAVDGDVAATPLDPQGKNPRLHLPVLSIYLDAYMHYRCLLNPAHFAHSSDQIHPRASPTGLFPDSLDYPLLRVHPPLPTRVSSIRLKLVSSFIINTNRHQTLRIKEPHLFPQGPRKGRSPQNKGTARKGRSRGGGAGPFSES